MTILNLFRRHAGFVLAPQATHERMEARHHVRPEFTVPISYAELMVMHREIGQRCAAKAQDTEELLWRAANLQILQRQAMAMMVNRDVAPPVFFHINKNIEKWKADLRVKPAPAPRRTIRQLCFGFFKNELQSA